MSLAEHRQAIDAIDAKIVELLNDRTRHVLEIGSIKTKQGQEIYAPHRERAVLQKVCKLNRGPITNDGLRAIYREVMSSALSLEKSLSIAYLGPEATFTHQAALRRFGASLAYSPQKTIADVFHEVSRHRADYGVVPVENSTEGAVGRTLDLLLQSPLKICGEVMLPVHQCLMSLEVDLASVKRVYSHPQSLGQCQGWLNTHLPNAERVPVASNAEAAALASRQPLTAAIAGKMAAEHYAVPVRAENIEDDPRNTTRFLVLGDQDVAPSGRDKTSLILSAPNRPGAVHDLLTPLARHDVSMTKFESRPARSGLWEYVFFMDIEGHQSDATVAAALAELKQAAAFVKVLGSYPVAV
jgi:chorismate mutase/prephenate dehydratase